MTVEQLRTVVASLRAAVAFSRALSGSMPLLAQLLASSTLSDVQASHEAHTRFSLLVRSARVPTSTSTHNAANSVHFCCWARLLL